jgi:N-carbamoyl-L-amino-acid hydrolase
MSGGTLENGRPLTDAMRFVPSRGGISHNPLEATDDEHLVLGTRALAHCLVHLCNEAS